MKKVQSGQKLRIPASTFNTFIDAARDYQQRTRHIGQKSEPTTRQASIVLVRNDSGAARSRFEILGIDSAIIAPADNLDEFANRVALVGVTPTTAGHAGRFVVLAEPLAAGALGRAQVAGACPVRVDITDTDHRFAEVDDGDPTRLTSARAGSARVLWAEGGTGEQWGVVLLGSSGESAGDNDKVKVTSAEAAPDYLDNQIAADETWLHKAVTSSGDDRTLKISHVGPNATDPGGLTWVVQAGDQCSFDSRGHIICVTRP